MASFHAIAPRRHKIRVAEGQPGLPGRTISLAWQVGLWPDRPAGRDPPTKY